MTHHAKISQTPLLPLNPGEAIFAPFHDPDLAKEIPFRIEPQSAEGCRHEFFWCWTMVSWTRSRAGEPAATVDVDTDLAVAPFDTLVFSVTMDERTSVQISARIDGSWCPLGEAVSGTNYRMEIHRAIAGTRIGGVRAEFRSFDGEKRCVYLVWIGLRSSETVEADARSIVPWNPEWRGLIRPDAEWPAVKFARGLLFDEKHLGTLRAKKFSPAWREHFALLESKARDHLHRVPEQDCGDFLPWGDNRYIRAKEKGRTPFFLEAQTLALVGLVNDDRAMCRHALRYLMCILHTKNWTQSAESRVPGSFWDQRCYLEEMACTTASLLLDWFDFALTRRAKQLARTVLWDKGLAFIERDLAKHEYLHHTNQGPWFCRGRILAGLMIEKSWAKFGNYTDRAVAALRAALDNYILADGGTDEGMGYYCVTLHAVLPALMAYARVRKKSLRWLLPRHLKKSAEFFAAQSTVEPGKFVVDADTSGNFPVGDAVALMASLYPNSSCGDVLATGLARRPPFTFNHHYTVDNLFGFALGPDVIKPPRRIVPRSAQFSKSGYTGCFLESGGRSLRIHFCGAKAKASHTHYDKGNFTVEIDGIPFLIDRGIVRYDDIRAVLMKPASMHNSITPVLDDGSFADQAFSERATIPAGKCAGGGWRASIDLGHVWREQMNACERRIHATGVDTFVVVDKGTLKEKRAVAFHLQSYFPFRIEGTRVLLKGGGRTLQIDAPWAVEISQREESIDFATRPVFHLVATSRVAEKFSLTTEFVRIA